jgi:hypothetical protein
VEWYSRLDWIAQISVVLIAVTLFAYLFGALGPATDADSLDYHLGVPLDWLEAGHAYPRPDWLTARLVGLGEMINLVGLASGTDCLGALFQLAGLLAAAVAVADLAESDRDRLVGWLLVVSAPVMLSLVFSEKPSVLPAGATTLAIVMLIKHWRCFDAPSMWVVFVAVAVAFAVSCKYTFVLSGAVVLGMAAIATGHSGRLATGLLIIALVMLALPGQVWVRNLHFYGDPLTPFLERFKTKPDPDLIGFATMLRTCCNETGATRYLLLPARLIGLVHVGDISSVLGIGTIGFLGCVGLSAHEHRALLWAAVVASALVMGLSQVAPRFFLEPYLWCAAGLVACPNRRFDRGLQCALVVQGSLVAAIALFGAVTLFPGFLTWHGRMSVMSKMADGYDETRWLNALLPADSWLVTTVRSHALLERRFVVDDDSRALACALKRDALQFAVVDYPSSRTTRDQVLLRCLGVRFAGPNEFRQATRNPFNRGTPYKLEVVKLDLHRDGCREWISQSSSCH